MNFMNTIITGDKSWVYGYDPKPVILLTNENPKRALNYYLTQTLLAIN